MEYLFEKTARFDAKKARKSAKDQKQILKTKQKILGSENIIEERSATIVLTGSSDGEFWVGSMWSSLIEDSDATGYVEEIREWLSHFKHRKTTGRALVFIYLLGVLCTKLSACYEDIMEELEGYVELGVSFFTGLH